MSRRAATLVVASALILVLGIVGVLLPVPYVALTPGPTYNTLDKTEDGKPRILIDGRRVYEDGGHLNFTTVAYRGGPGNRIDLLTALRGWLDDETAIVPEETIFPKNESVKDVERENTRQMADSQSNAVAAALNQLKIPIGTRVLVDSVQAGMPAEGLLRPGDEIVAVDGRKVTGVEAVTTEMGSRKPGDKVTLTVVRGGKQQDVTVTTVASSDGKRAVVGVLLGQDYRFPFKVTITVGDVGGPSAGLMFSLAIVDKLTPGPLTGGKFVAGTGTITPEGRVGPIGGIQQKMIAARQAGATIFLTPADNCGDAVPAAPKGLRLVRVETLDGAIKALDALRTGQGEVPSCPRN
ncbi:MULTISPECIES: YlbL family protein [Thermomonospora]|uniref:endopeptidase La n=1 Tax=Thermomonospora curvata (strain ATCC 19995 / DSM 43183 / JCM 3096 / KCTC 9072 / NBRC 15933 / NCIMB 10081 / Henssen B9) TaxID=471852 RepID=D1ACK1_THECD|nr:MULTISPECIES: PDZ domain-containing protein [Thermomonospora]ACY99260.1 peptidase S16 lon domain protein [Thermomonospora curvata DSM 43183]PKK12322.1 MAG: PDZ domain-containing protein [Thermomonospora sp. CIF 1]